MSVAKILTHESRTITSKATGKEYTLDVITVDTDGFQGQEWQAFHNSKRPIEVGGTYDLIFKEGERNGYPTYDWVFNDSIEGRMSQLTALYESMALDISAIKLALQIADAPKTKKVKAPKNADGTTPEGSYPWQE